MTAASFFRSGTVSVCCAVILACPVEVLARQSESARLQSSRLAEQVNTLGVGAEVTVVLTVSSPGAETSVRGKISAINPTGFDLEIQPGRVRRFTYAGGEVRQVRLRGSSDRIQVSWSELQDAVGSRKVRLSLPSGVRVEGKVAAVMPDALLLDVSKTSDSQAAPKGRLSIPRTSTSELTVRGSNKGAIIGGIAGGAAGIPIFVGASIAANETGNGSSGLEFLWIVATVVGGVFLGGLMDRPDRTIVITNPVP